MSISYHEQFQENQRKKNWNGLFSNSKATAGGQLLAQRRTDVVKQPLRSDTFTLPSKRDETNVKVSEVNQRQNASRTRKPPVVNPLPPVETNRPISMRRTAAKQSTVDRTNIQRKPVRFANNYNQTSSSPPAYYPKTVPLADPLPEDYLERTRRMHISNDDQLIHRRKNSPAYTYSDYQTVSNNIPTTSYMTSLPSISQPMNPTAPTVIIHPKETLSSDPPTVIIHSKENSHPRSPTVIRTVSTIPSYPPSAPVMFLPSSTAPTSTMFLPNTTLPSYPPTSTMFLPTTTAPTQAPVQTFFLQPPANSTYLSQPLFYPMPFSKPNPPPAPLPLPPPQQTIISQSSSTSVSAPTIENKNERNHPTIVFQPNSTNNKKNLTIQLKMLDEDYSPQRVVRVVRDPPYREANDVYYVDSEPPARVIYEQPRRRTEIMRRPPVNEYVYVDDSPATVVRRHPHRSEAVYIDDDRSVDYEEEIVYVDDHNREIEYIYDDEPSYPRRNHRRYRHPSALTNIVYQ